MLSKLGVEPLHWLQNPTIVGTENVGGTDTTHIRAGINVTALLADFNTFLSRASSLGVSGASNFPHGISTASQARIAAAVKNPHFDVWTGNGDKTIRKLQIALTLPVTGQVSTLLGGLSSADIGLSMKYSDLNQPQTIAAPTSVAPFSQFQAKLHTFEQGIQSALTSQVPAAHRHPEQLELELRLERHIRSDDHARRLGGLVQVPGLLAMHPGRGHRRRED